MKSLLRVTKFTFKYWPSILISLTAMILQVATGFLIPMLVAKTINELSVDTAYSDLIIVGLTVIGIAFIGLLFGILNNFTSQRVAMYSTADLRTALFEKIESLSTKKVDDFKTSRLITTSTNDVVRIQQYFQMLLRIIVRAPLMLIMGLIFSISFSKELSQIFFVSLPLLIIAIVAIMFVAFPRFSKVQKTIDGLNKVALETANSPRVIKSFVSMDHENEKFEKANQLFKRVNTAANKVMVVAEPIIMLIFNVSFTAIIVLGAYYVDKDLMWIVNDSGESVPAVGTLFAFSTYSMQVLFGLMMFAMVMVFISRALASAKRIDEVLSEVSDITNCDDCVTDFKMKGAIEFKNVSFAYESDGNQVLNDISFKVKAGEKVGIIGSTGSGKSTIVQLIPRLYDVVEGEVLIDGVNVKQIDTKTLRSQISLVTQSATIFSGSLATNILQGKKNASIDELEESVKQAQAFEFVKEYDDLYNHKVEQKGTNLSGGQKQRLSLARAFIRNPKVLILDDSTSAVDAQSEELILSEIEKISKETTSIIIAQKISTIKNMDNILVLNNKGQVDGYDTHENLLKNSAVYQEIAQSQLGNGGGLDA